MSRSIGRISSAEGKAVDCTATPDSLVSPPPKRPKKNSRRLHEEICGTLFASFPLIGFLLFSAVPVCIALVTMFCEMNGMNIMTIHWNSFANFAKVFSDTTFWRSFLVSLEMTVAHIIGLLISILIAAILSQKIKGGKLFTVIFFIPYVCSSAAISIMWVQIFKPAGGVINSILQGLGVANPPDWFRDAAYFPWMLVITIAWKAPGYGILMVQAALTNVNPSLYEAAKIDGAGNFTVLFRIMMPMVAGTYFTVLLLNFIAFWNDYQVPLIYLPTHPPVALGLYKFNFASSGSLSNVPMKLAGSFLVLLPVLVVFLAFHKRILGKIHMGGLKE